jgi:ABC-type lipoprotein export system ATPase subunit
VFQRYHLIDNLTVYENLYIPLSYRNVKGSERAAMECDALDRFHIVGKDGGEITYNEMPACASNRAGGRPATNIG